MSSNLEKSIEIKKQIKTNGYAVVVWQSEHLKPLDTDFTKALDDLVDSNIGNEPTKKRF